MKSADFPSTPAQNRLTTRLTYLSILIVVLALFWSDIIFRNRILFFFDLSGIYYPLFSVMSDAFKQGHFPLWTPNMFAGLPPASDGSMGAFYPINMILFWLFSTLTAYRIVFPLHILIVSLGVYVWLYKLTKSELSALVGALVFSLGGYWTARALHLGIWMTGAWIPWGLWTIENYLDTHKAKWPLLWGLFFSMQILAGFVQLAFYFIWITLIYALLNWKRLFPQGIKKGISSVTGIWATALILSVGIGMAQIALGWDLTKVSVRQEGVEGLAKYVGSFSPAHLLTFISPDLFGRIRPWDIASDKVNWMEIFVNYWESAIYIGIPSLFLIYFALRSYKKDIKVKILALIAVISILIAFGMFNPIMLLLQEVPGWKFFRVHSRFNFFTTLMLAGLVGIGLTNIINDAKTRSNNWFKGIRKFTLILTAIWVGACIAGNIFFRVLWHPISQINFRLIQDFQHNIEFIRNSFLPYNPVQWTPLLFILAAYVLFYMMYKKRLKLSIACASLIVLLAGDLFVHHITLNPSIPAEAVVDEPDLARFLKSDTSFNRIYVRESESFKSFDSENYWLERIKYVPPPHQLMWGGMDYINSFGPLKLKRIDEILPLLSTAGKIPNLEAQYKFLQFAGVKYIITDSHLEQPNWDLAYHDTTVSPALLVYQSQAPQPRAILLDSVQVLDSHDIRNGLLNGDFDLSKIALMEKAPNLTFKPSDSVPLGEITKTAEDINSIEYTVSANKNVMLILKDTYYPGWKAFLDGEEVEIYHVDYVFRGVEINQGKHQVVFAYQPTSFKVGGIISLISLGLTLGGILIVGNKRL